MNEWDVSASLEQRVVPAGNDALRRRGEIRCVAALEGVMTFGPEYVEKLSQLTGSESP